jgi:hypothetical protein
MAKGIVRHLNQQRGMVAIETEGNGFTIVELMGDEFEIGDLVQWDNAMGLGSQTYRNLTQRKSVRLIAQNHAVSQSNLREQLLLR